MGDKRTFAGMFEALTGFAPMPWQERLYCDWFAKGKIPCSCNLPTGLGKTMVMAIWLSARALQPDAIAVTPSKRWGRTRKIEEVGRHVNSLFGLGRK